MARIRLKMPAAHQTSLSIERPWRGNEASRPKTTDARESKSIFIGRARAGAIIIAQIKSKRAVFCKMRAEAARPVGKSSHRDARRRGEEAMSPS